MTGSPKDRWYFAENRRRLRRAAQANTSSSRRLLSLICMLGLVLILMHQAADPKYIQQAFTALGVPLAESSEGQATGEGALTPEAPSSARAESQNRSSVNFTTAKEEYPVWVSACTDLIARLLDPASPSQIDALASQWFSKPTANEPALQSTSLENDSASQFKRIRQKLSNTADSKESEEWLTLVDQFERLWNAFIVGRLSASDKAASLSSDSRLSAYEVRYSVFQQQMTRYLDSRLLRDLRDAAPWLSSESVGFCRLLQRCQEPVTESRTLPLLSTRQLLANHESLKGSWIRFRGSVRRIETVQRLAALLEQSHYYLLWLRGEDRSSQPVAVYTTLAMVEQFELAIANESFPDVELVGFVGKRLAYGSGSGLQIAPTIFANFLIVSSDNVSLNRSDSATNALTSPTNKFFNMSRWSIAALFVCLAIGLGYYWRTVKRPRRYLGSQLLLAVACVCWPCQATAQQPLDSAIVPPWARDESSIPTRQSIIQQRLSTAIDGQKLPEIAGFLVRQIDLMPESILKILFAMEQIDWQAEWLADGVELSGNCRLELRKLKGRILAAESIPLTPGQQSWFSLSPRRSIYRLQLSASDSTEPNQEQQIELFCLEIPELWKDAAVLNQPIQVSSFVLRWTNDAESHSSECYFARGPRWQIPTALLSELASLQPKIPVQWYPLARQGWDLAWFDLLSSQNQKRLAMRESEPLQVMLKIAADSLPSESFSVSPLDAMQHPLQHLGAAVDWTVRLVSGSVVDIGSAQNSIAESTDEPLPTRYYQLDGFISIPNQTIKYIHPESDQSITFKNEFPVTILTTSVASEIIPHQRIAAGEMSWKIGQVRQVRGRFLRLWSYESQKLSSSDVRGRQIAPLLIGVDFAPTNLIPPASTFSLWMTATIAGLFTLAMVVWVWNKVRGHRLRSTS